MKLLLSDKKRIYIETDRYSYQIKEYTGKFDKKRPDVELYNVHGYFQTLHGALKKWMSMQIKEVGEVTAEELMEQLQVIENKIEKLEVE